MKSQFASSMAKSGFRDIIMGKAPEDRSVYDMTLLMDTLNDKQKKYASVWANTTKGVENILSDTVVDKKKDFDKDKTLTSLKGKEKIPVRSANNVHIDFDATLQPVDPRQMVNLVVHTLTHIFPRVCIF